MKKVSSNYLCTDIRRHNLYSIQYFSFHLKHVQEFTFSEVIYLFHCFQKKSSFHVYFHIKATERKILVVSLGTDRNMSSTFSPSNYFFLNLIEYAEYYKKTHFSCSRRGNLLGFQKSSESKLTWNYTKFSSHFHGFLQEDYGLFHWSQWIQRKKCSRMPNLITCFLLESFFSWKVSKAILYG